MSIDRRTWTRFHPSTQNDRPSGIPPAAPDGQSDYGLGVRVCLEVERAERDNHSMIQSAAGCSLPLGSHWLASDRAKQCCNVFGRDKAGMVLTADALNGMPGCIYCAVTLPTCAILFCMDENTKRCRHRVSL